MCAALIGNLEWLKKACSEGVDGREVCLTCLTGEERYVEEVVSRADVVVVMTDQVSHRARRNIVSVASGKSIPVYMRHSSGANLVQACLGGVAAG